MSAVGWREGVDKDRALRLVPWLAGLLLALATLKCTYLESTWWMGQLALGTVFGLASAGLALQTLLKNRLPTWRGTAIGLAWALLVMVYLGGLCHSYGLDGLYKMAQLLSVFCLFAFVSSLSWTPALVRWFAAGFTMTLLACWGTAAYLESTVPANANGIGILAILGFSASVLGFLSGKGRFARVFFFALIALFVLLLVYSRSRSCWLAFCVFAASYVLYAPLLRRRLFYAMWFAGLVAVLGFFVYISVVQSRKESALERQLMWINEALLEKRFETREGVWTPLVDVIRAHPLTGMGLGWTREVIEESGSSAHSVYMQLGIQVGLPGIAAFLLLLYTIGSGLAKPTADVRYGRLGCALLLAMVVHEGFEIVLTDNMLPFGVCFWTLFGLCMSLHLRQNGMRGREARKA